MLDPLKGVVIVKSRESLIGIEDQQGRTDAGEDLVVVVTTNEVVQDFRLVHD